MQRRICMKGCLAEIAEMRPVRLYPITLVLMISGCAGPMGTHTRRDGKVVRHLVRRLISDHNSHHKYCS